MSKRRFTDTGKWSQVWFRGLAPDAKLVFLYLLDNCDDGGFWEIDNDSVSFYTGLSNDKVIDALASLLDVQRIEPTQGYFFIRKFCKYQYPNGLKRGFNPHKSVFRSLDKHKINVKDIFNSEALGKAWATKQDKELDKDKDKDKELELEIDKELDNGILKGRRNGRNN